MNSDDMLMNEEFAPITSRIGFLEAPLEQVAKKLRRWRADIHGRARIKRFSGGLRENIVRLEPLTVASYPRELLVATANPKWTAIFDSCAAGGDPHSTIDVLAREMHLHGLVVSSRSDAKDEAGGDLRLGSRQFQMYEPYPTGLGFLNEGRWVSVMRETRRWRFDAEGPVQPFEEVEAYSRRSVQERFTQEMLVRYCAALGLEPFEESFYPGPCILVENSERPTAVLSLAEVRRQLGYAESGSATDDGS